MAEVKKRGGQIEDLTGQVFGRLTVIKQDGFTKYRLSKWLCACSCGNEKVIVSGNLKTGTTTSCGCYQKEVSLQVSQTHGMTRTQEHYSWLDIKKRVQGKTEKYKRDYVDRGITMHPDFESFSTFYKEIGSRPDDQRVWSVGRIDNNLGYTYGNIRWETVTQQARNRTKRTDNKTGVNGVSVNEKSYVAQCKLLDGKVKTKSFSINKYGKDEAFRLACDYRKKMIEELNAQGAGYSDNHGRNK